jgi:hypothetical protein
MGFNSTSAVEITMQLRLTHPSDTHMQNVRVGLEGS